jgi:hypothetical protein
MENNEEEPVTSDNEPAQDNDEISDVQDEDGANTANFG